MLAGTQKPMLGTKLNRAHPLAKGLVGGWLFNEGVGNIAYDSSGYGNHGTLTNIAAPPTTASGWNPGRKGPAIALDGDNDYIDCGNDPSLNITDTITVEAWAKFNDIDENSKDVVYGATGTTAGYLFQFVKRADSANSNFDNTFGLQWDKGPESPYSYKLVNIKDIWNNNEWHHVVGVYDGANTKIYLDGIDTALVQDDTYAFPSELSNTHTISGSAGYFNGSIDEVKIYNRVLGAEEITWLYRASYAMFERGELLL